MTVPRTVLAVYPLVLAGAARRAAPAVPLLEGQPPRLRRAHAEPTRPGARRRARRAKRWCATCVARTATRRSASSTTTRSLRGARCTAIPVLGTLDQLPQLARETAAEMLVIAMPAANKAQMRRVVDLCEAVRPAVPHGAAPARMSSPAARASTSSRKSRSRTCSAANRCTSTGPRSARGLSGKRVLVTGGGGSIGSELCRQVARLGAESLTVLELSEYNLYRIEQELRRDYPGPAVQCVARRLRRCDDAANALFAQARPQVVFHAAAYKHVPLLQGQVARSVPQQRARHANRGRRLPIAMASTASC